MRRECEASVVIHAPPEAVWSVVSDVTRVGEWSGECRGCVWVGGSKIAATGARFRGRNRRGAMRWTRLNEIVRAEAPNELVWRTVPSGPYPDSVEWHLGITAKAQGCEVIESFRVVKIPKVMEWGLSIVMPAHRDRTQDLADDLNRLKNLVEATADSSA
jgi:uncharacterized protein YndB with AHSA1/START domain